MKTISIDIQQVQKGDIVRFKTYALRVETEPTIKNNSISLSGRTSINGCPFVTKRFIGSQLVNVERD